MGCLRWSCLASGVCGWRPGLKNDLEALKVMGGLMGFGLLVFVDGVTSSKMTLGA
jgi:hypothetical protein